MAAASQAQHAANKRVAIIGGGVSGLMTAVKLRQLGMKNVVVFDTGKTTIGGRTSSRDVKVSLPGGSQQVIRFDHSAQVLSANTPRFQRMLDHWQSEGLIESYKSGTIGSLNALDGAFTARGSDLPQAYYTPKGLRALCAHLAENVDVKRPVWVGKVSRRDPSPGAPVMWDVYGDRNQHMGAFDYLVVAHNGKCADRLMSTADAPSIHALLRTKFTPQATQQQVMQMCSLWVGMFVFPRNLQLPYEAAFVDNDNVLSWISNNTARMPGINAVAGNNCEAWTLVSTRQFGTDNKVPQENVPPAKDKEVKATLLDALSRVARIPRSDLSPVFEKVQLWGAAVPLNVTNTPCVLDIETACGSCGDWLVAPSIEGAALSGVALAENIAAHAAGKLTNSIGLDCKFKPTISPPIGAVPVPQSSLPAPSTSDNQSNRGSGGGYNRTNGNRGPRGGNAQSNSASRPGSGQRPAQQAQHRSAARDTPVGQKAVAASGGQGARSGNAPAPARGGWANMGGQPGAPQLVRPNRAAQ